MICNICGKKIEDKEGVYEEDFLHIIKSWGYFSNKDGETHEIIICEKCYDMLESKNKYPTIKYDTKELL